MPISSWLNIKQFGSTGNGSTDDTDAIQSAIGVAENFHAENNRGGTAVYFPPPVNYYKTSAKLTVDKAGIALVGNNSTYGPRIINTTTDILELTANSYGSSVSGLAFEGAVGSNDVGLKMLAANTLCQNCKFDRMGTGVLAQTGDKITLRNVFGESLTRTPVELRDTVDASVSGVSYRHNHAVRQERATYGLLNNGAQGSRIRDVTTLRTVNGLTISSSVLNSADNIIVSDSFFAEAEEAGVEIASFNSGKHVQNVLIVNCSYGGHRRCFYTRGGSGGTISNVNTVLCQQSYPNKNFGGYDEFGNVITTANASLPGCAIDVTLGEIFTFDNCPIGAMNGGTALIQASAPNARLIFTGGVLGQISGVGSSSYIFSMTGGSSCSVNGSHITTEAYETAPFYISDGGTIDFHGVTGLAHWSAGTAQVDSNATSVTFSHNMDVTPDMGDVHIVPSSSLGAASFLWVSSVTATHVTVNVDANPGADVSFSWKIVNNRQT